MEDIFNDLFGNVDPCIKKCMRFIFYLRMPATFNRYFYFFLLDYFAHMICSLLSS